MKGKSKENEDWELEQSIPSAYRLFSSGARDTLGHLGAALCPLGEGVLESQTHPQQVWNMASMSLTSYIEGEVGK